MASPNTTTNGQIQPRTGGAAVAKPRTEGGLVGLLQSMGPEIARALPRHLTPERMARVCLTALRVNPQLMQCTPASFMAAIMASAQLGLEPNTPLGHCYLIPYKDTCQLILGYQGLMELALRSGKVTSIKAVVVRQGDRFEFEQGLNDKLVHVPAGNDDAPITHVYAVAKIKDGDPIFTVLSRPQIEARRKRGASGMGRKTPWDTDFEAMAQKTAIRALFKWIPKSAEMATATAIDEAQERFATISNVVPEVHDSLATAGLVEKQIDAASYDTTTGEVLEPEDLASAAAKIDAGEA